MKVQTRQRPRRSCLSLEVSRLSTRALPLPAVPPPLRHRLGAIASPAAQASVTPESHAAEPPSQLTLCRFALRHRSVRSLVRPQRIYARHFPSVTHVSAERPAVPVTPESQGIGQPLLVWAENWAREHATVALTLTRKMHERA